MEIIATGLWAGWYLDEVELCASARQRRQFRRDLAAGRVSLDGTWQTRVLHVHKRQPGETRPLDW
jgi:hypothetical protein